MKRARSSNDCENEACAVRSCALQRATRAGSLVALSAGCLAISCGPEQTITVATVQDGMSGSLRAAIATANADPESDYRIELPPGQYALTECGRDDTNAGGDLDLTSPARLTIVGSGDYTVIEQRCAGERVLDARSARLTLERVRITGGTLTGSGILQGGGVRADGDVMLTDAAIINNSATTTPADDCADEATCVRGVYGGGLYVGGSLGATGAVIANNVARGADAIRTPDASEPDPGVDALGGGAYVVGALSVQSSSIMANQALGGEGASGFFSTGGGSKGGDARGGGLAQAADSESSIQLQRLQVFDNVAEGGSSADDVSTGSDIVLGSGGSAWGGAIALGKAAAVLADVEISSNRAVGGSSGTGPCPERCAGRTDPGAALGGAIAGRGSITLQRSFLDDNRAQSGDTAFFRFGFAQTPSGTPAAEAVGGAVYSIGAVTTLGTTYRRNSATQGTGTERDGTYARGGAIASDGSVTASGGSFDANRAEGGLSSGRGGAVSGEGLVLDATEFTNNVARGDGGAAIGLNLHADSVVADANQAGGLGGGAFAVALAATITRSRITNNVVQSALEFAPRAGLTPGGGGIRAGTAVELTDTAVIGNSGDSRVRFPGGTIEFSFAGGGVYAGSVRAGSVTLANNVVSGPTAAPSSPFHGVTGGGAIAARGSVTAVNATLIGNRVNPFPVVSSFILPNRGAAVLAHRLELEHATVADNTGTDTLDVRELLSNRSVATAPESEAGAWAVCALGVAGDPASFDNWFNDASCALPANDTNEQAPAAFLLGALADNGGPVPTSLPGPGSVLVDRVPSERCTTPFDARLVSRLSGDFCDIGAVEIGTVEQWAALHVVLER